MVGKRHDLAKPNPLSCLFEASVAGKLCDIEYEPNPQLCHSEKVQQLEADGIEEFLRGELAPYAPDSWYVLGSAKIAGR